MKAIVPEIAWHNKKPVFSVHIQPDLNNGFYRAATGGGDSHVVVWHLVLKEIEDKKTVSVDCVADLERHVKAVNVVRFSNDSTYLASGDDDGVIIIWGLSEDQENFNKSISNPEGNKENWVSIKVLRGHKDDIYDVCWSPLSDMLLSGSVDNSAILWDVNKGQSIEKVGDHHGFVQGVAWDPDDDYICTLSTDRALRVFHADTRKLVSKVSKTKFRNISAEENAEGEENLMRLFNDETTITFFRRLCFSPDGNLILAPCGLYMEKDGDETSQQDVTYIFLKSNPERPIFHLPSMDEFTVAVCCCPVLFELNDVDCNLFTLPYRMIFAIASTDSIVFYDTQQLQPIGVITDIHYAALTDLSWSADGSLLLASSSDGFCTIVTFEKDELGVPYTKPLECSDDSLESSPSSPENDCVVVENGLEPIEITPVKNDSGSLENNRANNQESSVNNATSLENNPASSLNQAESTVNTSTPLEINSPLENNSASDQNNPASSTNNPTPLEIDIPSENNPASSLNQPESSANTSTPLEINSPSEDNSTSNQNNPASLTNNPTPLEFNPPSENNPASSANNPPPEEDKTIALETINDNQRYMEEPMEIDP